jgi:cytochrome P450
MTSDLPFLDVLAPNFSFNAPAVHALRDESWLVRTPIGYAVLRYEDASVLLKEDRLHQGSVAILKMRGVTDGPLVEWWNAVILNLDGAEHTRLRRLVGKAFTPPAVERLRPFFRACARQLADAFDASGRVEFVQAFSEAYPLQGICEMLGIPTERRKSFYGWAGDFGLIFSQRIGEPAIRAKAEAALAALYACADDVIADRRRAPGEDLVSALVAAEDDGDRLSTAELRAMIAGLVFAGNDTTRNQLGLGMLAFCDHPEQWTLLRTRPELAPRAVDEMMRLYPTISAVPRIVHEDFEYKGMSFKRGMFVALGLAAANADARIFGGAPFDIATDRPSGHLTFSGGIHRCLGMWLARAEMQEALGVLSSRFASVALDGEPVWQPGLGIDGPTTLPLCFAAAVSA